MKRSIWIAAVLAVSLLAPAAQADHRSVSDGPDARGPLDVRRVDHSGGGWPKWKITTFNKWSRRRILDQGFVMVYLDTFGSKRHDYYALVWADKDRIRATLMRDREYKSDFPVTGLRVWRPSTQSVRLVVPLHKMRVAANRATYNWYVQSLWSGEKCKQVCFDWAPNIGSRGLGIEEPLPLPG